ncbi:hypothetical protein OFC04_24075, partial [Escherichia coli]|nr:hypothetical protein [Escherichia coli]
SNSIVLSLPIAINSSTCRFENSIYNPLAEISVYNNPEAALTIKTSDKIEENNKILKKFITKANKSTNYKTISIKDRY